MRIEAVTQDDAGGTVNFADATRRRFDLLIIAEGIRSTTRNDVFAGEPDCRDLGYYTSYRTIPKIADGDQWWRWYTTTRGRAVQLRPDNVGTTRASLDFRSPPTGLDTANPTSRVGVGILRGVVRIAGVALGFRRRLTRR